MSKNKVWITAWAFLFTTWVPAQGQEANLKIGIQPGDFLLCFPSVDFESGIGERLTFQAEFSALQLDARC